MSLSLSCARATITKVMPDRKADDDGAKFTTVALRIEVKCSPDILAEFHPTLRDALFRREGGVRFPPMKEIGWEGSRRGIDLAIRPAPDLKPAVSLTDVRMRDFKLKPITEGTQDLVAMRFTADVENPSAPVGRILEYLKENAWIDIHGGGELDLAPPSARTEIEGFGEPAGTPSAAAGEPPPVAPTPAEVEGHVVAIRRLQPSRKGAKAKLSGYPDEVLRAAIKAEEEAPNTRALMVAMLEAELERRAEESKS